MVLGSSSEENLDDTKCAMSVTDDHKGVHKLETKVGYPFESLLGKSQQPEVWYSEDEEIDRMKRKMDKLKSAGARIRRDIEKDRLKKELDQLRHRLKELRDVWFVGNSYVHWLEKRLQFRKIQSNLGVSSIARVKWISCRGMHWSEFNQMLQLQCLHSSPPKYLVIHLGSNDLTSTTGCELQHKVRGDIVLWMGNLPNTTFIFSELLPRLSWGQTDIPFQKIKKKRKHFNNRIRPFICAKGGYFVKHDDINIDTPVDVLQRWNTLVRRRLRYDAFEFDKSV